MGAFHSRALLATHTPAPRAPNVSGGCHTRRNPQQVSKEPAFFHSMRIFPGYNESPGTETVTKVGGTSPPMELTQQVSEWTHRRKAHQRVHGSCPNTRYTHTCEYMWKTSGKGTITEQEVGTLFLLTVFPSVVIILFLHCHNHISFYNYKERVGIFKRPRPALKSVDETEFLVAPRTAPLPWCSE